MNATVENSFEQNHNNNLTLTLAQRRVLMLDELSKSDSKTPYQEVISQLYESLTGDILRRDTDPDNGEDYLYKGDRNECASSMGLHEEVVEFFGFKNRYLKGGKNDECVGYNTSVNAEIAQTLSNDLGGYFYLLY